jgi:hypothetical protein
MADEWKTLLRRMVFRSLLAALVSVCFLLVIVPLDQSPFLRDVAEPITLITGHHEWKSDQVWDAVTFMDARHVERYARYVIASYAPIEIHDTLILGKEQVRARGRDEREFLGLLQRWYGQDAEARELTDPSKDPDFFRLTEQQQAKVIGVGIMRTLLKRN